MEEIVKLEEFNWVSGRDAITIALCNTIIGKQNEIIDYLNSQSQPVEQRTPEQIREEFDKERVREWDKTAMETYKQATEDTPEEKEDKKLYIAVEDILSDYHIGVFTDAFYITKLVELFKNLLSERAREGAVFTDMELIAIKIAVQRSLKFEKGFGTKNEMIPNGYEEILRKLSKLTTK